MTDERARAALSTDPDLTSSPDEGHGAVPGTVRLMTEEPVEMAALGETAGLLHRVSRELAQRPWLVPAALLTVIALILAGRRL